MKHMSAPVPAGLCSSCQHAQTIASDRGPTYIWCSLSRTGPEYPKYPRLPVAACAGWTADGRTSKREITNAG
jgi:hypothetical protein